MFDSAPTNLPIESKPPTLPRQVPAQGMINQSGVQEPEDIFAGMDEPELKASLADKPQVLPMAPVGAGFPWKIVVTVLVPLVVIGLGVGGWYYFVGSKKDAKTVQVPTNKQTAETVPVQQVPDQKQPLDNPVPKPDESKLAAAQAAMTLMQEQAGQGYPGNALAPTSTEVTTSTILQILGATSTPFDNPSETSNNSGSQSQIQAPLDSDQDGLSNSEELLLGTDAMQSDSDGDGFPDKSEILNGYDPAVKSGKLSDSSSLRKETFGSLVVLIPEAWKRQAGNGGTVDFLTGTPAVINISMQPYAESMPLVDWVSAQEKAASRSDYGQEKTPLGFDVVYSKDGQKAWILAGNTVYGFSYNSNGALTLDFGSIFHDIMVRQARTSN